MGIKHMLMMETEDVFNYFIGEARALKRKLFTDNINYLFIKGTQRICLVAHIDTVGGEWQAGKRVAVKKRLHERHGIITAFKEGTKTRTVLGADDRAGCYGLMEIMKIDERPSILLTNFEECGGIGARIFTEQTELWKNFDFMVELDRQGCNEYVQYNNNPHEVHAFLAKFGIKNGGHGSYSDIATISRATKIPSVNMAIGYTGQHGDHEYLDIAAMNLAITKTKLIVHRYCQDKPEFGSIKEKVYEPVKRVYYFDKKDFNNEDIEKCAECGQTNGYHYRSCPDYVEPVDDFRQPALLM